VVREGLNLPEAEGISDSPRWDLVLLVLLGGHLVWLFSHFLAITVGPDAGGLFVQARLLATQFTTSFRPESPLQFLGTHWIETPDGDFLSRYPPGFPLLLALAYALGGPGAPFFLNPVLATSVVALTYLMGRRWLGRGMAFWAAMVVVALPILNRLALHGDAHLAATALLLLGIWLLFRWQDDPSNGRAFVAGLALGLLPTVRYPEAVVGLAVLAFFLTQKDRDRGWKGLLAGAVGAAIPMVILAGYNASVYGAPWRTGYGFTNEQSAFSFTHLGANLPTYLGAFATGASGLWFLVGLLGMIWMVRLRESRARGVLLMGAVVSLTLLYGAYYWGAQEEADLILRYFLVTLPLLALGAGWFVNRIPYRRVALASLALLSLLYLARALPSSSEALLEEWVGVARGQAIVDVASVGIPEGSVIIARREIQDMLDYFGRWRLVDDRMIPGTPARQEATLVWELSQEDRDRYAHLPTPVQITKGVEARARYVGLSDLELATLVFEDIQDWVGPDQRVFWFGNPTTVEAFGRLVGSRVRIQPLEEVEMPGWGGATLLPAWVPKAPLVLFRVEFVP